MTGAETRGWLVVAGLGPGAEALVTAIRRYAK